MLHVLTKAHSVTGFLKFFFGTKFLLRRMYIHVLVVYMIVKCVCVHVYDGVMCVHVCVCVCDGVMSVMV